MRGVREGDDHTFADVASKRGSVVADGSLSYRPLPVCEEEASACAEAAGRNRIHECAATRQA
jgi:hypothetical protein